MQPTTITRIKICCIQDREEARSAIEAGASAIGLVSAMPSGPGCISEETIAQIAAVAPPAIGTFLLTCKQDVASIVAQQRKVRTNTIQICDRLEHGRYEDLRDQLPGISLVQVIHVTGPESIDEALSVAPFVNGLLLDSGNPSLPVKELGGTGRRHDWAISRAIRERAPIPLFLAGGLNPDNVAEAIRQVGPFGVDVCSGLRTDGRLDPEKLSRFMRTAGLPHR